MQKKMSPLSGRASGCAPLRTFSAALLILSQSGCLAVLVGGAVAAGATGYAYVKGESTATLEAPMEPSWNAALAALEDLRLAVISKSGDALTGAITARNAEDTRIAISLRRVSDNTTRIGVRVGTFGDESQSRAILDKIAARL